MMDYLDILQRINNLLFKILDDKSIVINFQVWINSQRHELDLPDKKELIDEYVQ